MLNRPAHSLDWNFIINWTLVSLVGLLLGTTAKGFIYPLVFAMVGGGMLGQAAEGAAIGLVIGLAQQLALPPHLPCRTGWWLTTSFGWAIGWSVGWGLGWQPPANFVLIGLIAGLVAGLGQWLLLRRQVKWAGWWLVVSPLAWAGGLGLGLAVGGAFGWPLAGGLAGLLSGLALARVARQA